jgi:serine/threonine-protein phosphatase PGAM5
MIRSVLKRGTLLVLLGALLGVAPQIGSSESHAPATQYARTVYLVRHGAYDSSVETTSPDGPGLTPLGIAEARLVGSRLRGLPTRITALTSSTMTRARQTAAVVHESLPSVPIRLSNALRECTPPMRSDERRDAKGEEEQRACAGTLDDAFARYFVPARSSEQHDVLICHGNVIRYFVTKALGADTKAWLGMTVAHASLTVIKIRANGSMVVLAVGDVGHIPPNLQSWGSEGDPQLLVPTPASAGG